LRVHEDAASGRSLSGRHGVLAALEDVESGEASALIVAKLDRLSRSLPDFARLMERSLRSGWSVVALDLGVDTTTPAGTLVANVVASVAHCERRLIGARTREALAVKRAQGVRLGRPRSLSPSLPGRVLALRRSGLALAAIADQLTVEQVPTPTGRSRWHPTTVRTALAVA
jgi:DNA invertase Pin-like site-specific DNA recombinase